MANAADPGLTPAVTLARVAAAPGFQAQSDAGIYYNCVQEVAP